MAKQPEKKPTLLGKAARNAGKAAVKAAVTKPKKGETRKGNAKRDAKAGAAKAVPAPIRTVARLLKKNPKR